MDWKVIAALTLLAVAIVVGLVTVMYTSVSRYARRLDPAMRGREDHGQTSAKGLGRGAGG